MATIAQKLEGPLVLELPDGSTVRIQPGPYGKGVSVVPLTPRKPGTGGRGRGRPPNPATIELRALLAKDVAAKKVKPSRDYIEWLAKKLPKSARTTLQQTVYRELRAAGARPPAGSRGDGRPGRAPHPATVQLRERLAADKGSLKDASHYVKWLVEKSDLGIKQARPIVYRELRAVKA